jgi:hypothetical protein
VPQAPINGIQNAEQRSSHFMLKGMEREIFRAQQKNMCPPKAFGFLSAHIF